MRSNSKKHLRQTGGGCGMRQTGGGCGMRQTGGALPSQTGAGSTDYAHSFYSWGVDPAQLSRYTLSHINEAPMFNPLSLKTVIPTGTSGVIPTGAYYDSMSPMTPQSSAPAPQTGGGCGMRQTGGGGNSWIRHVKSYAQRHRMKYSDAMKDAQCRRQYHQSK